MQNVLSVVPHDNDAFDHIVGAVGFDVGQECSKPRGSVEKGEHDRNLVVNRIKQSLVALEAVPVVGSVVQKCVVTNTRSNTPINALGQRCAI